MKVLALMTVFLVAMSCSRYKHHKHHWKKMDADGDNRISKAEFTKYTQNKFGQMDANKDGFVTKEEKKAWKKNKKKYCQKKH